MLRISVLVVIIILLVFSRLAPDDLELEILAIVWTVLSVAIMVVVHILRGRLARRRREVAESHFTDGLIYRFVATLHILAWLMEIVAILFISVGVISLWLPADDQARQVYSRDAVVAILYTLTVCIVLILYADNATREDLKRQAEESRQDEEES